MLVKNKILPFMAVLLLAACSKKDAEAVRPEPADTPDWYVLQSPDARPIESVAGDLDGTLVISTMFHIYQTKDRGRTWQLSDYQDKQGILGFGVVQDTLLALRSTTGASLPTSTEYAILPEFASLDQGATWVRYHDHRHYNGPMLLVARNRALSPSGTEYHIDYRLTPTAPNSGSSYVETIGITSTAGNYLSLPQRHNITSLSFDARARLYVTASAALCGTLEKFAYCGPENGLLYVSKKPQL